MAFSYGFFNAQNRDRVYTAEDFTSYLSSLICNGIQDTYGRCFEVTANNNLTVTIGTGKAWINGHYFINDANYNIDLHNHVNSTLNRYVLICICLDTDARQCEIVVKPGSPGQFPAIPTVYNMGSQIYLTLAAVYLSAGCGMIIASDITDFRDDDSRCGYVKCILGKCSVSDLIDRINALEELTAALDEQLNPQKKGDGSVLLFSDAAIGSTEIVGQLDTGVNGLVSITGLLDSVKVEKEDN